MGTARDASSKCPGTWKRVAKVVVSVGPYPLTILVPGSRSRALRMWLGDNASPPVRIWRNPRRISGLVSMIWLNRLEVSQVVVMPCLKIVSPSDRKSGRSSQRNDQLRAMKQGAPDLECRGVE